MLKVEIIYISSEGIIFQKHLQCAVGSTIDDVIYKSDAEQLYPEVSSLAVGIFSVIMSRATVVKDGDRVEIYRSLLRDPKDKRREKAKLQKIKVCNQS
jgi:putative ubiquitin-RnfH superfamily antitoxin RatB of RatAB toxin-antitoxin module